MIARMIEQLQTPKPAERKSLSRSTSRAGLEPATFGFEDRSEFSRSTDERNGYDAVTRNALQILKDYPDLSAVVAAWPLLDETRRAIILSIVRGVG